MIISPASEDHGDGKVAQKTVQGFVWSFSAHFLGKIVVLITTSILARLLSKNDFGLIAISIAAMNYLSVLKDLGLGMALIQRRGQVREVADTVFTINTAMGLVLSILVIPLAPLAAMYFQDPQLTPVLRWLGISLFINALGSAHSNLLVRDLDYRRKVIPDIVSSVLKGIVSIGLALLGYGVWSLVAGHIVAGITSVILVWIMLPWRPRLAVDRKVAGGILKFGISVTAIDVISEITDNIDYVIVGRVFGLIPLSIYTFAYRLPEMLLIGNLWVMGRVVFPAFSKMQERPDRLRQGFLASVRIVQLFALPICLGLLLAADPIVRVLFGNQWLDTIPIMRVLAVYAWIYSLGYHVGGLYRAIGRPDISLRLSVLSLFIIIPSLLFGARFGLIGVAIAHLVEIIIRRILSIHIATRFVELSMAEILGELKPSLLVGVVMAPVVFLILRLTTELNPFPQLALVGLSGVASYAGVLWLVEKENLLRFVQLVRTTS